MRKRAWLDRALSLPNWNVGWVTKSTADPRNTPLLANAVCFSMLERMNNSRRSRHMQIHRYTVIFEPAEEGGYVVHVPPQWCCDTRRDA